MATTTKKTVTKYLSSIAPKTGLSSLFEAAPRSSASSTYLGSIRPESGLSALFSGRKTQMPTIPDAPMSRAPISPFVSAPVAPVAPPARTGSSQVEPGGSRGTAPVAPTASAPETASTPEIPKQWLNADGSIKTPEQIAADLGSTLKKSQGNGDIGTLAGNQFGGAEKTAEQLRAEAMQINNTRNDIAVGENDPYKVASKSGIAYTPAELSAIEKAYAGIYDPALTTALAKVEQKQIEDEAARKSAEDLARDQRQNAFELTKMEKQFGYDKALKQTPTPGQLGSGSYSGVYTPGENPVVDAWAKRIFDGSAKITDIPASDKGLRNAVTVALQASGNDLLGRPTATELGIKSREAAKDLLNKVKNREGTSAVGGSRIFGGSLAIPGSDKANFLIDFQNLKDMLSLEGTRYLKGQGQVSDAERALLASAVTKLNLSQSDGENGDFKSTLEDIVSTLSGTNEALTSAGAGESPSSGLPPSMILNGQVLYLQADGTYE